MNELISQLNNLYILFQKLYNTLTHRDMVFVLSSIIMFLSLIIAFIYCMAQSIETPSYMFVFFVITIIVGFCFFNFYKKSNISKTTKEIEQTQEVVQIHNEYDKKIVKIAKKYPYILCPKINQIYTGINKTNFSDEYYFMMCKNKISENDLKQIDSKGINKINNEYIIIKYDYPSNKHFSLSSKDKIKNTKKFKYKLYSTKDFFEKLFDRTVSSFCDYEKNQ